VPRRLRGQGMLHRSKRLGRGVSPALQPFEFCFTLGQ